MSKEGKTNLNYMSFFMLYDFIKEQKGKRDDEEFLIKTKEQRQDGISLTSQIGQ